MRDKSQNLVGDELKDEAERAQRTGHLPPQQVENEDDRQRRAQKPTKTGHMPAQLKNRSVSEDGPMTGAQETYLKALCEAANKPVPDKELTRAEATEIIDRLKDENRDRAVYRVISHQNPIARIRMTISPVTNMPTRRCSRDGCCSLI